MLKKTIIMLILAMNFAIAVNSLAQDVPYPHCYPCPPDDTRGGGF
jgi:hypothetical protein